ncbi:MAG: enoate reductase [Clostridiales bacterium]|nr:enoate reductase [Clostridiales bacterium]
MTNKLYPYTKMFSPIKINKLKIKNRLVMGPMGNISMCEETGRPNHQMISYFEERARGGVGLITTGLVPVSHGIDPTVTELHNLSYFPRIDKSRTNFAGWRDLSYACHSNGAHVFIQLTPGLGRVGNPQCLLNSFKLPVSASWNPNYYMSAIPCRPLSNGALKKIIKRTGQAAADAKAANIDGVYLHGHEGYLMEQLTNPAFNRRKMGHFADWQAFGIDTIKQIRKRVGKNYPIMYRIDLSLALNATYGEKLSKIKSLRKFRHERRVEETLTYMANLVKAGVDIFDVDLGCYDNWWLPHPPATMPPGCFLEVSKLVKDYFKEIGLKSNVGEEVPVVAVGKLGYPDLAEKALREEMCDMVMLARPLLADPEWANKAYSGNVKSIIPCIGCHEACIKEFVEGGHPQCAVNPRTAFEFEFSKDIPESPIKKKIAVIGAGPAGIVASQTLIARGHKVDLYEKSNVLGGMLNAAGKAKIKYEIENYRKYLESQVEELKKNKQFSLFLKTNVTEEKLKSQNYDTIVVATGTKQLPINIEGANGKNVATAVDVYLNPDLVKNAQDITILGGGDNGCELAYMLAYEYGKNVNIVDIAPNFMTHSCTANRGHILHYLEEIGVKAYNCTKTTKIEEGKIIVEQNVSKTVPNPYNTWAPVLPENVENPLAKKIKEQYETKEIKTDYCIIAFGQVANDDLYYSLQEKNIAKEIYNIGDSNRPGKVFTAVKTAYRKCRNI